MGKYGDEGDKLIFKILNNGIGDPKNIDKAKTAFDQVLKGKNDKNLTERALKYDLTIPFARWVAMNHAQLTLPFKRYQIQPVWRADRPQKGRYREFTQCDADVVGSRSLWNEVELACIYHYSFIRLGIRDYELRINNRKILAALAELCGGAGKMVDISIAIDKLDKIGMEKVKEELGSKGISENQLALVEQYLQINGDNQQQLKHAEVLLGKTETGKKGIEELSTVLTETASSGQSPNLIVDFTLARGLNYYTGTIFEVNTKGVQMGSIGGGGRYDDLTGLFGVPNIPGVGISFGVDRIYDVMEELSLFTATFQVSTKVFFFNLGEKQISFTFLLSSC
jgi:histidyl-tRNA synthetase